MKLALQIIFALAVAPLVVWASVLLADWIGRMP